MLAVIRNRSTVRVWIGPVGSLAEVVVDLPRSRPVHRTMTHRELLEIVPRERPAPAGARPRPLHRTPVQSGQRRRVLIVGSGDVAQALAAELEEHFGHEIAVVGFGADRGTSAHRWPILGRSHEVPELIRRYRIDEVMIADPCHPGALRAWANGHVGARREHGAYPVVKRAFDIAFSLGALAVAAPAVALAALAIKLTSPGPVLYRQERIGRDGSLFTIFKLRTMVDGAENATGPVLARRGDPRITPLGRFLRASKLDEVPQFYNVLRGQMSVIGPRPERPCFVEAFSRHIPDYPRRHGVRPGITGLAQVNGGYLTHVHVKLRYDLTYIARCSFRMDLWILGRTIRAVLENLNGDH
jgi:lipopolysaccharide/colanic/teichoic acid biosynthesis glycosyltransferase